jgi:hypothetical protein
LPTVVRVIAAEHPLAGRALRARRVYRRYGRRWLVVELPDGGVVSVEVEDTDVIEAAPLVSAPVGQNTLSRDGARRLLGLVEACTARSATDTPGEGERDEG